MCREGVGIAELNKRRDLGLLTYQRIEMGDKGGNYKVAALGAANYVYLNFSMKIIAKRKETSLKERTN